MQNDDFPMGNGQTLLVVEDEVLLRMMIADVMEGLNYKVLLAQSGAQALAMIDDGARFDLLLTDIVLPGDVCGFELAQLVRDQFPTMPVIYSSGYPGGGDVDMGGIEAPMLEKPAGPSELAQLVHRTLVNAQLKAA